MADDTDVRGISSDSGGVLSDSGNMRGAWKWLTASFVVLTALVVSSLMSGERPARRQLVEYVARIDASECQPVLRRGAAYGELHDGEAFAHYAAVLLAVAKHQLSWQCIGEKGPAESMPLAALQARREWQAVLEDMRLGAHSRSVATESKVDRLIYCWWPVALRECQLLLEEGEFVSAVRVWLDTATFACDVSLASPGEFGGELRMIVRGMHDDHLGQLPRDALAELIQGLEWLDSGMPESCEMERDLARAARYVMGDSFRGLEMHWQARLWAWRDGFSLQQQAIGSVARQLAALPSLSPGAATWSERMRQFDRFERASRPAPSDSVGWFRQKEILHRQTLADLRMLLTACRIHYGAQVLALRDPLSDGVMLVEDGAKTITLRCGESPGWARTVTK